jgi:predicted TIM-barrel fold metal-dependent hydrolase
MSAAPGRPKQARTEAGGEGIPVSVFEEPKVDCHCHVLDPARFPYAPEVAYRPGGQEIAPFEQYLQMADAYGIRHALMVGPNSGYGLDNRCLLDALARGGGRFKGIAVVPPDIDCDALMELRARGIVGVAFNATLLGTAYYQNAGPLLRLLAELDMLVSLQVEGDQLVELSPLVERSEARVLIDHCGRPASRQGVAQPGFQALLGLARTGRVAVKLSGLQKFSALPPPYDDTRPYLDALLQAFTLDACLWASDWPFLRAPQRLDVGPLLRGVERLLPDASDRRKLFWDTPRRWLKF